MRVVSIFITSFYLLIIICVLFYSYNYIENFDDNNINNLNLKNNYLDGIDVIYWINLDKSTERKQKMENVFTDPIFSNIPTHRISAVNGKCKNIKSILNNNFINMSNQYSNIEYSCLLSHLNAIKEFHNSNYKNALIMEDDNTLEFKKYWKKPIQNIINDAPSDWEVLQLTYTSNITPNKLYTINNNKYQNAGAYLINKTGSSKINKLYNQINNKYNLPNNIEHLSDYIIYNICITYTYKYPYFIYADDNNSEIHTDHVIMYHIPNKEKIKKLLNK